MVSYMTSCAWRALCAHVEITLNPLSILLGPVEITALSGHYLICPFILFLATGTTLEHILHGDPNISLELNEKLCHLIHSFVKDTNRFK